MIERAPRAVAPAAPGAPPAVAPAPLSPAVQALLSAADNAAAQQQWDRAEAALERAIKLAPSRSRLWQQLAYAYLKGGDVERARQVAQRALTLALADGDENVAAWRLIGDIEQARGNSRAAADARAAALRLLPHGSEPAIDM